MQPETTLYHPKYRAQILELATDLWTTDPGMNSAYLTWKYESNPHAGDPLLYLALERGRVVGMRGAYGMAWERSDTGEGLAALGMGDLVIAADRRGQGVFGPIMSFALGDLRARGYHFALNLSAGPATYIQSVRSGWHDVGPMATVSSRRARERLVRRARAHLKRLPVPTRWRSVLRRWGRPTLEATAATRGQPFAHLDRSEPPPQGQSSFRISIEREPRAEAMAELIRRLEAPARLRHRRDAGHIRWRYQNPLCQYRFLFLEKDSRLEGYLALQAPMSASGLTARIVDWEASHDDVERALLDQARRLGQFDTIDTWSATLSPSRAANLARSGFRRVEEPSGHSYRRALLVRSLNASGEPSERVFAGLDLTDLQSWDLQMIDSDGY